MNHFNPYNNGMMQYYQSQVKEFQDKQRKEFGEFQNKMKQYMQSMQGNPPVNGAPAEQGEVMPAGMQQLAILGEMKALLVEMRDHMKGTKTAETAVEQTEVSDIQSQKSKKNAQPQS